MMVCRNDIQHTLKAFDALVGSLVGGWSGYQTCGATSVKPELWCFAGMASGIRSKHATSWWVCYVMVIGVRKVLDNSCQTRVTVVCRNGYRHTLKACNELVGLLRAGGPEKVWDIDHACLSETMDVIAQFGFGHDFQAVKWAVRLSRNLSECWAEPACSAKLWTSSLNLASAVTSRLSSMLLGCHGNLQTVSCCYFYCQAVKYIVEGVWRLERVSSRS